MNEALTQHTRIRLFLCAILAITSACGDDDGPAGDGGTQRDLGADATVLDAGRDARGPDDARATDDARADEDAATTDGARPDDDAGPIDASSGDGGGSSSGDCDDPIDLARDGEAIEGGFALAIDFAVRRDLVTPSCQDDGLVDVVVRFVPTRDGIVQARTSRGSAALAAYGAACGAEVDCQYDGAYSVVGLLDFDGRAGEPVDLVVSARSPLSTVSLEVRELEPLAEGDACDVRAVTSACSSGLACGPAGGSDTRCSATNDVGCGPGFAAIDLSDDWLTSQQLAYATTFRGATDRTGVSCGRGADEDVVVAVRSSFRARITSVGAINLGAVVSVRAGCLDSAGEVGCSLGTRVPPEHVFAANESIYFVLQRIDDHVGDEVILDVVRELLLAEGDACTEAAGAPPGSLCMDGLVCDETSARCRPTVCRDGVPEGLEACDDMNDVAGDGCAPDCTLEDQGDGADGCPGAPLRLVPGPGGTYVAHATGTTAGHDDDTDGADCPGVFMSGDVRYELSAPTGGEVTLTFDEMGAWDPAVRLHEGACGGSRVSAPVLACISSATMPDPWIITGDVGGGPFSITIDQGLGRSGGPYSLTVTLRP